MAVNCDLILRPNFPEEEPAFKLEMPPELAAVMESNMHTATIMANAGEAFDEMNARLDHIHRFTYEWAAAEAAAHAKIDEMNDKIEELTTTVDEMQGVIDETSVHVQDLQQDVQAGRSDTEEIVRQTAEHVGQLFDRVMEIQENLKALEKAIMWLCSRQNSAVSSEFSSD